MVDALKNVNDDLELKTSLKSQIVRRRACCPDLLKQLVICRFLRLPAPVTLVFQLVVSLDWYGMV